MDDEQGKPPPLPARAARCEPSAVAPSRNGPPPPRKARSPSPGNPGKDEAVRVTPNKNRLLQVRRTGGRRLFDATRKEVFLEWFAATCNVRLSAGKARVHEKTVYKHLAKDAAFLEAFGWAVQLGYMRLEARQLQEAHQLRLRASHARSAQATPVTLSAPQGREGYAIGCELDEELVEEHFDPQLALHLLREHRRHLPGAPGDKRKAGAAPRAASNREIADALAKRLKAFGVRVQRGGTDEPQR